VTWRRGGLLALIVLFSVSPAGAQGRITAGNAATYLGDGRWDWTVYIQASADTIRSIRCVEYTLHPTFPNPVRQVCNPGSGPGFFPLRSEGWGTFQIPIKIQFANGRTQTLTHQLHFAPPKAAQTSTALAVDNVARQDGPRQWSWTIFLKGPEQALSQVRCVQYTLHPTFPKPVQEVCERGNGPQAFALSGTGWGTFEVKVRVLTRSGQVQELRHQLRF
jgi:transcription initiation factor IIF auxiliary subunit